MFVFINQMRLLGFSYYSMFSVIQDRISRSDFSVRNGLRLHLNGHTMRLISHFTSSSNQQTIFILC